MDPEDLDLPRQILLFRGLRPSQVPRVDSKLIFKLVKEVKLARLCNISDELELINNCQQFIMFFTT